MSIRKPFRYEPLADLIDRGTYYLVTVDLPHVNKDNIHIYLDDDTVLIHAENEYTSDDGSYNRVVYDREFTLPDDADSSTIRVSFKEGMLRITMNKRQGGKTEIPIRRRTTATHLRHPMSPLGKMKDNLIYKIAPTGKALFLAYDHGIEHGPTDFNETSVDPAFIMDIAEKGKFEAVVFHKGVAEKYYNGRVPLILKLNGKTKLREGDPVSRAVCTVEEALSLGAAAVGYTVYAGSDFEREMFSEFGEIVREAHRLDVPVVLWSYPRGHSIKDQFAPDVVAYAARVGLELGADAVKVEYTGNPENFKWVVKSAGKVKVFMAGGPKAANDEAFLTQVKGVIDAGGAGLAVGRNVWQHKEPLKISKALRSIVMDGKGVKEAMQAAGLS